MAEDERPDFDLFSLLQGPATMMSGMKDLADNGRKAVTGFLDTIASLQRAAAALEQLAGRVDRLVADLEAPLRLLSPELEKVAIRVQRIADLMDGPIDRLLPGLEQAVDTFDRIALSQLPDSLDALRSQIGSIVEVFAEVPRRLGATGGLSAVAHLFPGMERFIDASARLTSIASNDSLVPTAARRSENIQEDVVKLSRKTAQGATAQGATAQGATGKKATKQEKRIEALATNKPVAKLATKRDTVKSAYAKKVSAKKVSVKTATAKKVSAKKVSAVKDSVPKRSA